MRPHYWPSSHIGLLNSNKWNIPANVSRLITLFSKVNWLGSTCKCSVPLELHCHKQTSSYPWYSDCRAPTPSFSQISDLIPTTNKMESADTETRGNFVRLFFFFFSCCFLHHPSSHHQSLSGCDSRHLGKTVPWRFSFYLKHTYLSSPRMRGICRVSFKSSATWMSLWPTLVPCF